MGIYIRTAAILFVVCSIVRASAGDQFAHAPRSASAGPDRISLLDCLTFGPTEAASSSSVAMTSRALDGHLHPAGNDRLPAAARVEIDAHSISQKPMAAPVADIAERSRALQAITNPDLKRAARQAFQQALNDRIDQVALQKVFADVQPRT